MIAPPGTVTFSVLMRYVLNALCTTPDEPTTTQDIVRVGGQMITPSQLPSALNKLRKLKWIKRDKRTIGEKLVGVNYYPVIKNFYGMQPGRADLWREIEPRLDMMGRIHIEQIKEAQQDLDERWANANLDSMRKGTDLETSVEPKPPEQEPEYIPYKEPFFKWHTIMDEGIRQSQPYMTRIMIGRLRLHIFHRGDLDADPHDHPWDFWTFPLRSYVEEVAVPIGNGQFELRKNIVKSFRLHFRPAEHRHRVIGPYAGYLLIPPTGSILHSLAMPMSADKANLRMAVNPEYEPVVSKRQIVTIVWRGKFIRRWGFWKQRGGKWCWQFYKTYIWEGGKNEPCGD